MQHHPFPVSVNRPTKLPLANRVLPFEIRVARQILTPLLIQAGRLHGKNACPADACGQLPGRRQRPVANLLRWQADTRKPREQPVLRIDPVEISPSLGGLPIGRGVHDQPVHRLHVPVALGEAYRQPVEQLRMGRAVAVIPKILHRPHETLAKVMLPNTIDSHPRSQRLFVGEKPPCKI